MCGYAGLVPGVDASEFLNANLLAAMGNAIKNRGPDDQGVWINNELGIGLVHQRLAIQDLSPLGAQPMASASRRFTICFNGEIYNFKRLRAELINLGYEFRGGSDTEVMLAAFEAWGVEEALVRFNGMFSIALVDHHEQQLWLIRDRMGEKPLYYCHRGQSLVFASELKSLMVFPQFRREIEPGAVALLLRHNYIPAPWSIFKDTFKLEPAHYLCFNLARMTDQPIKKKYWNPDLSWNRVLTPASIYEQLEPLLKEVIADQMISDAPLGAFLSGGIDSSTIVALMQSQAKQPVKTFSVGFNVPGFNEAEHAKIISRHLGTEHTEYYVDANDALNIIPQLASIYDEPFADSSQIPTYIVSRMTRRDVTVALSGDGGDELFAGYSRYANYAHRFANPAQGLQRIMNILPDPAAVKLTKLLKSNQRNLPDTLVLEKILRYKTAASAKNARDFYCNQVGYWVNPELAVRDAQRLPYSLDQVVQREDATSTFQWCDINSYLPDDILVKVDRAAMANSLETRVPLLDHRVVEFALGIPTSLNVERETTKQPLRNILYQYVPRELVDRPKQGFAVPKAQWLKNELRDWAEDLLSTAALEKHGFFDVKQVRAKWQAHLFTEHDYSFHLWSILMFQCWYQEYM